MAFATGFLTRLIPPHLILTFKLISPSHLSSSQPTVSFQSHFRLIFDSYFTPPTFPAYSRFCLFLPVLRFCLIVAFPSVRKDRSSLSLQFFCRHSIARRRFLMKARTVNAYFENYVFSLFLLFITSVFNNESGVFQVVSEQRKEGG